MTADVRERAQPPVLAGAPLKARSVLACGGAGGVCLMSDAGRERVLDQQAAGVDLVLDIPMRWGMGYCLNTEIVPASGGSRVAWWAGGGGSMSFVDVDRRFSFGYVPNRWITGAHEMDRSPAAAQRGLPRALTRRRCSRWIRVGPRPRRWGSGAG